VEYAAVIEFARRNVGLRTGGVPHVLIPVTATPRSLESILEVWSPSKGLQIVTQPYRMMPNPLACPPLRPISYPIVPNRVHRRLHLIVSNFGPVQGRNNQEGLGEILKAYESLSNGSSSHYWKFLGY
jgi:hypothetical protein